MLKTSGTRNGKTFEGNTVHVVHYNAEGQITESWIIPQDAAEVDDFWS